MNTGRAAVRATIITIDDNKTTIIEFGNRRFILTARCCAVNHKLAALRHARIVKTLGRHRTGRTIGAAILIPPGHDKTAARQRSHIRLILGIHRLCIDLELRAERRAVSGKALAKDTEATAIRTATAAIGAPNDNVTAIRQGRC